jgi:phenylacetate-coenzyme A ligase PaaK-like adenylate-forming protein
MIDPARLAAVRDRLERNRALPYFRRKYRAAGTLARPADLGRVPPMDKADLARVAPELRGRIRAGERGAYVFASGGTTGAPKFSFLDGGLHVADVVRHWRPLAPDDVFLNLFAPGRLWSAHYFYNELALALGAITVPLGDIEAHEHEAWAAFAEDFGVTALGGTPTALRRFLGSCRAEGRRLEAVRAVLWVGEPFTAELGDLVTAVAADAGLWGLYGSTETWVIACNFPECAPDVFHPLPEQVLELDDDGALLGTTTYSAALNPILRYRIGDRASFASCRCERGDGVRVHGRADAAVKFRGVLIHPEELVDLAGSLRGVDDAQVAILTGNGRERLELRCVADSGSRTSEETLRRLVLARSLDLGNLFDGDPDGFRVAFVPRLSTNRSGKTPALVREEEA